MKVIINLKPLRDGSKTRGIGVYTRELIVALKKRYPKDKFIPTTSDYYNNDADLVHFPYFDPFFLTLPIKKALPTIVTIHDLTPLKFPQHFRPGLRGKLKLIIQKKSIKRVNHIITDSESSKNDIINILNIKNEKITVIPLAPSLPSRKISKSLEKKVKQIYKLPDKYLLYVGDINWNKNIPGLISEFSQVKDQSLNLVLVGKAFRSKSNVKERAEIKAAIANSKKSAIIKRIGYIPSHHLPAIYSQALMYVQPSFYEGFGLPILEAMQYGCPTLTSNQGSLKEVGGEAAVYFNPQKIGQLSIAIHKLASSAPARKALSARGLKRAKEFTWKKTVQSTHEVYKKILAI